MGNRVFLTLCTPAQLDAGDGRPFAEAKNHFPTLWQLLLADSREGTPNTTQRVFFDADTGNLVGEVAPARERFALLQRYVLGQPRLNRIDGLDRAFAAFAAYLESESAQVRELAGEPDAPLLFSADLDELAWLDGDTDDFIARMAVQSAALWEGLREAIAEDDARRVAGLLEVEGVAWNAGEWSSWLWQFGFGGLDHPYFEDRERPRKISFEAFQRQRAEEEDALDYERVSFLADGLRGVRRRGEYDESDRYRPGEVLVPAQWDAVFDAGHRRRELYWVERGGRIGLLERGGDGAIAVLREPDLDEVAPFEDGPERTLAAAWIGGRAGLLRDDGRWQCAPDALAPPAQAIGGFSHGLARTESDGRVGYIDGDGRWRIEPRFDDGGDFNAEGRADAVRGGVAGLIDRDGNEIAGGFDRMDWDPDLPGWRVRRGGLHGWLHPDGREWIAPAWNELEPMPHGARIRARRKGGCGLLDWSGGERVAPRWRAIAPDPLADARDEGAAPRYLVRGEGRTGGHGLIDADGAELVPAVYAEIAAFDYWAEPGADGGEQWRTPPRLLSLRRKDDPQRGAWDLQRGREVLACAHDVAFPAVFWRDGERVVHGWLAGANFDGEDGPDQHLRVFDADGAPLHADGYAWIGEARFLEAETLSHLQSALLRAWSADAPVEAVRGDDGRFEWLYRDGRRVGHVEHLRARYAAGDRAAALRLARELRDGYGLPADPAQARQWMARAAGLELDAPPRRRGLLGRLFGGGVRDWSPDAAAGGEPEAMLELAAMLAEGVGGPEQPALARRWLQHLLERVDADNADANVRLGYLLQNGIGGEADAARALALFQRAAERGDRNAAYNLGHAYEFGHGAQIDLERALDWYRRAADADDGDGAHRAGLVAQLLAAREGAGREALLADAARRLRAAHANAEYEGAHVAGADLGALLWRGSAEERAEAERLWLQAAEAGHGPSIERLIALYGDEDSARRDPERAAHWRARR